MQITKLGKIMHLYIVAGRITPRLFGILMVTGITTLVLILGVPQFSLNQAGFKVSTYGLMALAQALVGILLFSSWGGILLLTVLVVVFIWPEIIFEIILRKKVLEIIQSQKDIFLSDLAKEVGVYEDDLGILLKHWIARRNKFHIDRDKRIYSGNNLSIDLMNKKISWKE
jgi:hypothetical protein